MWCSIYFVLYSCMLLYVNTSGTFGGSTDHLSIQPRSGDPSATNAYSSSTSSTVEMSVTSQGEIHDSNIEPVESEQNNDDITSAKIYLTNLWENDFTSSTQQNSETIALLTESREATGPEDFTATMSTTDSMIAEPVISLDQYKHETLMKLYKENATLRELTSSISELCPRWKPCLQVTVVVTPGGVPDSPARCCLSCTCDDTCLSTRSCCPGYQPNSTIKQPDYQDIPRLCVKSVLFTKTQKSIDKAREFDMIASCPAGTPEVLSDKCKALAPDLDPGDILYSFVDVVPITDALSSTNFANRHCAACNNLPEDRYLYWTISYDCYDSPPRDGISIEEEVQLRDDCLLNLQPPSYSIGNATRCFQNVISSCNITGQWEVYDSKTEAFCNNTDLLFYSAETSGKESVLYKNMFCAICNGDLYAAVNNASCIDISLGEFVRTFTAVLNFKPALDESSALDTSNPDYSCPPGHKVDPLSMQCKEVVCSQPRILNKISMECEEVYLKYNFGSMEVSFKGIISRKMMATELDVFDNQLKEHLSSTIGFAYCNFYSTFYHADTLYNSTDIEGFIDDLVITNLTVIAYVDLTFPLVRSADMIISTFLSIDSVIYNNQIYLTYGKSDTYFLPSVEDTVTIADAKVVFLDSAGVERRKKRDSLMFKVFQDPYDGTAVLTFASYEFADDCVADKLLYRKSYFDCPAFVYNMSKSKIIRIATGIVLQDGITNFDFGEFYSMNETHVAICLSKLEEKGFQTNLSLWNLSADASFGKIRRPTVEYMTLVITGVALLSSCVTSY